MNPGGDMTRINIPYEHLANTKAQPPLKIKNVVTINDFFTYKLK